MSKKKVFMSVTASAVIASTLAGAEDVNAASHSVKQGDTLWGISQKYETTVAQLKSWNNLSSNIILPKQNLEITDSGNVAAINKSALKKKPKPKKMSKPTTYTVVSGDTLSEIAYDHGISLYDLMSWNNLESTLIFPGDEFIISKDVDTKSDKPEKVEEPVTTVADKTAPEKEKAPEKITETPPVVEEVPSTEDITEPAEEPAETDEPEVDKVDKPQSEKPVVEEEPEENESADEQVGEETKENEPADVQVEEETEENEPADVQVEEETEENEPAVEQVEEETKENEPAVEQVEEETKENEPAVEQVEEVTKVNEPQVEKVQEKPKENKPQAEKVQEKPKENKPAAQPVKEKSPVVEKPKVEKPKVEKPKAEKPVVKEEAPKKEEKPKQEAKPTPTSGNLIDTAKSVIGTPYVWGGTSTSGFDCSGFIHWSLSNSGTNMGRMSTDGYYNRSYIVNSPEVGDFVFFEGTYRSGISHMGIYIGNNQFIHASSSQGVTITSLSNPYWSKHFHSFKKLY